MNSIAANPFHEDALQLAGYISAVTEQDDQARDYYSRYLDINPGNAAIRMRIAYAVTVALLPFASLHAQQVSSDVFDALKYRYIGPEGNRISAVEGIPGDPNIYYAGAASGGIFKTTDGGTYWEPIFDGEDALSIGWITICLLYTSPSPRD